MPPDLLHTILDAAADAINPLLVLVALVVAFARSKDSREALSPGRFLGGMALALAVAYLVHNTEGHVRLWARLGLDYSMHTAFFACVATSLVLADMRWAVPLLVLFAGYAGLMVAMGYHTVADIAVAAATLVPITVACHALLRPRPPRVPESPA